MQSKSNKFTEENRMASASVLAKSSPLNDKSPALNDSRPETAQLKSVIQLANKNVTNSHQETHSVWETNDIIADLTPAFSQWKLGQQDTSGHDASQAKKMLSSDFNKLIRNWQSRQDKTAQKSEIKFLVDNSLSGGSGVKSIKATTTEGGKYYSFVWHVRVVPD